MLKILSGALVATTLFAALGQPLADAQTRSAEQEYRDVTRCIAIEAALLRMMHTTDLDEYAIDTQKHKVGLLQGMLFALAEKLNLPESTMADDLSEASMVLSADEAQIMETMKFCATPERAAEVVAFSFSKQNYIQQFE